MLRKILGLKRGGGSETFRKLHEERICDLKGSPAYFWKIKLKLVCGEHKTWMGK
jgi:hypothetical protein